LVEITGDISLVGSPSRSGALLVVGNGGGLSPTIGSGGSIVIRVSFGGPVVSGGLFVAVFVVVRRPVISDAVDVIFMGGLRSRSFGSFG
jgi:hypothetical protein